MTSFVCPENVPDSLNLTPCGWRIRSMTELTAFRAVLRRLAGVITFDSCETPALGWCVRIAQQIALAFGVDIDKDIVCRVLAKRYRPGDCGTNGPSWLTFIGHVNDSVWSVVLFRCESIMTARSLGNVGHGRVYAQIRRLSNSRRHVILVVQSCKHRFRA